MAADRPKIDPVDQAQTNVSLTLFDSANGFKQTALRDVTDQSPLAPTIQLPLLQLYDSSVDGSFTAAAQDQHQNKQTERGSLQGIDESDKRAGSGSSRGAGGIIDQPGPNHDRTVKTASLTDGKSVLSKEERLKQSLDRYSEDARKQLGLGPNASTEELNKAISGQFDKLGSERFDEREAATRMLRSLGPAAVAEAVRRSINNADLETRNRSKEILDSNMGVGTTKALEQQQALQELRRNFPPGSNEYNEQLAQFLRNPAIRMSNEDSDHARAVSHELARARKELGDKTNPTIAAAEKRINDTLSLERHPVNMAEHRMALANRVAGKSPGEALDQLRMAMNDAPQRSAEHSVFYHAAAKALNLKEDRQWLDDAQKAGIDMKEIGRLRKLYLRNGKIQ